MSELCEKCRRAPASTATPDEVVAVVSALGACYHEWLGRGVIRCRIDIFCGNTLESRYATPYGASEWHEYDVAKARTDVLTAFLNAMESPAIRDLRAVVEKSERGQIPVPARTKEPSP
jgi:hypothetical protein